MGICLLSKINLLLKVLIFFLYDCSNSSQDTSLYHVFYLHGRIVEEQGIQAEHERFGKYLYQDIVDSLSVGNVEMYSEVRTSSTEFFAFGQHISRQIDSLIQIGVHSDHITVIGASKGGVIAMYISHLNPHPIRYVLLGANNEFIERENAWELHGNILAIVEESDQIAGRGVDYWKVHSPHATLRQLNIRSDLDHGFLYRPIMAWLQPAREWVKKGIY